MNAKLKKMAFILVTVFIVAFIALVILTYIDQKERDQEFTDSFIIPIAEEVIRMKVQLGRLPTTEEFRAWCDVEHENKLIDYHPTKPEFMESWGEKGEAFMIGAWNGDWIHYYCSWNGKNFPE